MKVLNFNFVTKYLLNKKSIAPETENGKDYVFGNEKGGSGKSTTAIHVAIGLCYKDKSVGVIDLDVRQKSMSRFLENRGLL